MIAGRLRWRERGRKLGLGPKIVLASFEFAHGTLWLTEAGSKKRASMQLVQGEDALNALNPGGVEPLQITSEQFREALTRENHTVKRALTDPRLFSGIGNAYSDEILHAARLSPLKLTRALADDEVGPALRVDASHASFVDRTSAARSQAAGFRRKSRPSATRWRSTAVSGCRVRSAERRCSESCTPTTSATTALVARRAVVCSLIARCRACSEKTGLERLRPVASAFRRR